MDAKHLGRVERRMPAEQALPDHGDHRRRYHDLRKIASGLAAGFRRARCRVRSARACRQDRATPLRDNRNRRCSETARPSATIRRTMSPRRVVTTSCAKVSRKTLERRANRSARRRRRGKPADQRHQRGPDQFLEQRLLVLEVQVDRALGDAGALGDVVEPCRGKSARDELIQRRIDDGLTPLRRARGAAGWRLGRAAFGNAGFGALAKAAFSPRRRLAGFDGALSAGVVRELVMSQI